MTKPVPLNAPHLLREWRVARGWSQGELGERVGVTGAAVSRWERGERSFSKATAKRLAAAFDMPIGQLYDQLDRREEQARPEPPPPRSPKPVDAEKTARPRLEQAKAAAKRTAGEFAARERPRPPHLDKAHAVETAYRATFKTAVERLAEGLLLLLSLAADKASDK